MRIMMVLLLAGCTSPPEYFAKMDEELHARLDPCRYDVIENDTGVMLCRAGDCGCHRRLVEKTFEEARKKRVR